jgi:class 3 adenylate cyclase/tetratricopeptide (TPR) repeat protein
VTENVVIAFTDLVDSTAIASRLGPEGAEVLRVEHFGLLRAVVRRHGGREVKNLGDGMMLRFSSGSSALAASVAIQQAVEARNRIVVPDEEQLLIRIGVSMGEADEEQGDFFGPPVVEAARLCNLCIGGQILTSALLQSFVGVRGGFAFEPLGPHDLKGLPEPTEVLTVAWEPAPDQLDPELISSSEGPGTWDHFPLPPRLSLAPRAIFAGRVEESACWAQAWKNAVAGEHRVWFIGGEAGIGKTSLVAHLAATAHASDATILYGRCDEDIGVPYQPWIEALSHLVAHAPADTIAEHAHARGGELARLIPGLVNRADVTAPTLVDAESARYALFGAVDDLLRRASHRRPILLVLDDLHWADRPTVQLLRHLAGLDGELHLMVLANFRPTDIGVDHPLSEAFAQLHRTDSVEFVDLLGLDDVELLDLMEATAGHELDAEGLALRDAISAETSGNAFFAVEILRHLAESGVLAEQNGRWTATTDLATVGLPVSVRHVVGERVRRLGPEAHRLLTAASVIGRDFDLALLAEITDADESDVLDVLDAAVEASLLLDAGFDRYTFAHALVEHSLAGELTPSRRGRVHQRIAQVLEATCGEDPGDRIGELAHHWAAAVVPEDLTKAADYARRAGDRSLLQLAPDEALRWYGQAIEIIERQSGHERTLVPLLIGRGTAERQIGDPAHRDTLLTAAAMAREAHDTEALVAAVIANHRGFASITGSVDTERLDMIESALDAIGPEPTARRARLLGIHAAELTYDTAPHRRIASAREAVHIARDLGDPAALLAALVGLTTSIHYVASAPCEEAVSLAQQLGDDATLASAAASLVTESLGTGDRNGFDRAVELCTAAAEHVGRPTLVWRSLIGQVVHAVVDGDLRRAEDLVERDLAVGLDSGQPDSLILYSALYATVRYHQGRFGELAELIDEASVANPDVAMIRAGRLVVHIEWGELALARSGLEREAANGFDANEDALRITYLCFLAHACARLGDDVHAPALLTLLEPHTNQIETAAATTFFSTSTCAGMLAALLGRADEADSYFSEAIQLVTAFRFPFLLASAQFEWARCLLDRTPPDSERAEQLLVEAIVTSRTYGFAGIERSIESLHSAGAAVR